MNTDHFAILLAINHYPGLNDLGGPLNDAAEFEKWLRSPAGGDVPQANIATILSAPSATAIDPYDALPQEVQFRKALDGFVRDLTKPERPWKQRAGQRLYIFMAGHGFTAGSAITDPALFSAVAQDGDPAHVSGYRYLAKLANAGFFKELVLIMDCCQDVLKASQVLDPSWSPPDRNKSDSVSVFYAFGAPRGKKAFERELGAEKKKHGLFTYTLIRALETAAADENGDVTGESLKKQLLQLWGTSFRNETDYVPPVHTPDNCDIVFYRRTPSAAVPEAVVTFSPATGWPANSTVEIYRNGSGQPYKQLPVNGNLSTPLPSGFFKAVLRGTPRSTLFEVLIDAKEVFL